MMLEALPLTDEQRATVMSRIELTIHSITPGALTRDLRIVKVIALAIALEVMCPEPTHGDLRLCDELHPLATCDWGQCDTFAVANRYDAHRGQWLPCCTDCALKMELVTV